MGSIMSYKYEEESNDDLIQKINSNKKHIERWNQEIKELDEDYDKTKYDSSKRAIRNQKAYLQLWVDQSNRQNEEFISALKDRGVSL